MVTKIRKIAFILFLTGFSLITQAADFFVSNSNDSGLGSLRQAIIDLNSSGATSINVYFGIPGTTATVSIFSPLPTITAPSVFIGDKNFGTYDLTINGNGIPGPLFRFTGTLSRNNFHKTINFSSNTYNVTTTANSGVGSLRLIQDYCEQTPAKDYIYFNISGQAPHQIATTSTLNTFFQPVVIDGQSQPANGYTGVMPKIELATAIILGGANSEIYGLTFSSTSLLYINARSRYYTYEKEIADNAIIGSVSKPNVFISPASILVEYAHNVKIQNNMIGMDFNSGVLPFSIYTRGIDSYRTKNLSIIKNVIGNYNDGMRLWSDTNVVITGNTVGTSIDGLNAIPNTIGINLATSCYNVQIGGVTVSERNIISGNKGAGVNVSFSSFIYLKGNYIGVDITGMASLPSTGGVTINGGDSLVIGGYMPGEGNVIASNLMSSYANLRGEIVIASTKRAYVYGNKIGVAKDGITPLGGLGRRGMLIGTTADVEIGNVSAGYGNIFSNYSFSAIFWDNNSLPQYIGNVVIRGNSFFNNSSGISNYNNTTPIITNVTATLIQGKSMPLAIIDLYVHNGTGKLQGKNFIGTVTSNVFGEWTYIGVITNPCFVTATATFTKRTSEFSQTYKFGNLGNDISTCKDIPIQLNASGGSDFNWTPVLVLDNAQVSNPTFVGNASQTFIVSLTNNLGCIGYDTITVIVNDPITPTLLSVVTDVTCNGLENGAISLVEQNANAINFLWETGETTADLLNLPAGMYNVAISDINGCNVLNESYSVTEPEELIVDFSLPSSQQLLCRTSETVFLSGGSPTGGEYSGQFVTLGEFTPISSGTHLITYSYSENGCSNFATQEILVNDCLGISESVLSDLVSLYPNPVKNEIKINRKMNSATSIIIYNSIGDVVKKIMLNIGEDSILVDDISNGVYFFQLENEEFKYSTSMLISH